MNSTFLIEPSECFAAPNYIVCETLTTLTQLMAGYYPIIDDLIRGLLQWPNLLIVTSGACILLGVTSHMICSILCLLFKGQK